MLFKRKKIVTVLDKRNAPRKEIFQSTYCKRNKGEKDCAVLVCFLINISTGGICFELKSRELEEGNILGILYKIWNNYFNHEIEVVHMSRKLNAYRFGCRFIDTDEKRNRIISDYILNS